MAYRTWARTLGTAAGAAFVAAACQLGIGTGLGLLRWDGDYTSRSAWHAQLVWLAFLAALAAVAGAAVGRWAPETFSGTTAEQRSGRWARVGLSLAAAVGAVVVIPVGTRPARAVHIPEPGTAMHAAVLVMLIGALVGAVIAYAALTVPAVGGNLVTYAIWLWLAALASALWTLGHTTPDPVSTPRNPVPAADLGLLPPGGTVMAVVLLLGAPALLAFGAASVSRLGGGGRLAVAGSGAAGPALVAAAYAIGGMRSVAYWCALAGVGVGLAVSAFVALARHTPTDDEDDAPGPRAYASRHEYPGEPEGWTGREWEREEPAGDRWSSDTTRPADGSDGTRWPEGELGRTELASSWSSEIASGWPRPALSSPSGAPDGESDGSGAGEPTAEPSGTGYSWSEPAPIEDLWSSPRTDPPSLYTDPTPVPEPLPLYSPPPVPEPVSLHTPPVPEPVSLYSPPPVPEPVSVYTSPEPLPTSTVSWPSIPDPAPSSTSSWSGTTSAPSGFADPVEAEPVAAVPVAVETGPVETGPVETRPVDAWPVEAGPVEPVALTGELLGPATEKWTVTNPEPPARRTRPTFFESAPAPEVPDAPTSRSRRGSLFDPEPAPVVEPSWGRYADEPDPGRHADPAPQREAQPEPRWDDEPSPDPAPAWDEEGSDGYPLADTEPEPEPAPAGKAGRKGKRRGGAEPTQPAPVTASDAEYVDWFKDLRGAVGKKGKS